MKQTWKKPTIAWIRVSLLLLLAPGAIADATNYTEDQCLTGFLSLNFDFQALDRYDEFYTNQSVYQLAQAGNYYGPSDIMEYVGIIAAEDSPYVSNTTLMAEQYIPTLFDAAKGTCAFVHLNTKRIEMNNENTNYGVFLEADMTKIVYEIPLNKVSQLTVLFTEELMVHFFDNLADSDKTRAYICNTMRTQCPSIYELNGSPNLEDCVARLSQLPMMTNGTYIDGNSQGCRFLHAHLAARNDFHCPHISFVPLEDKEGDIKCQKSQGRIAKAFFTQEELDLFDDYLMSEEGLVESPTGLKILEQDEVGSSTTVAPSSSTSGSSTVGWFHTAGALLAGLLLPQFTMLCV